MSSPHWGHVGLVSNTHRWHMSLTHTYGNVSTDVTELCGVWRISGCSLSKEKSDELQRKWTKTHFQVKLWPRPGLTSHWQAISHINADQTKLIDSVSSSIRSKSPHQPKVSEVDAILMLQVRFLWAVGKPHCSFSTVNVFCISVQNTTLQKLSHRGMLGNVENTCVCECFLLKETQQQKKRIFGRKNIDHNINTAWISDLEPSCKHVAAHPKTHF